MSIALAMVCLSLVLSACSGSKQSFKTTDITGSSIGGDSELLDHNGTLRHLADFRGRVLVVTFGFTNCPDVCPTTLLTLAQARKALGPDRQAVQVIMITADPNRDTAQVMSRYVTSFDPEFIGLIPTEAQLERVAKQFKVFIRRNTPDTNGFYTVDHTAASFVFDRQGRIRLFVPHHFTSEDWAADLRTLLLTG